MGNVNRQASGGLFGGTEVLMFTFSADPTADVAIGIFIPCKRLELLEIGFGAGATVNGTPSFQARQVTDGGLMDPAATATLIDSAANPSANKLNVKKLNVAIAGVSGTLLDAASPYQGIGVGLQLKYNRNGSTQGTGTGWIRYRPIENPQSYV